MSATTTVNLASFVVAAGRLQASAERLGPPPHTDKDVLNDIATRLGAGVWVECQTPDDATRVAAQFTDEALQQAFWTGLDLSLASGIVAGRCPELAVTLRATVTSALAKLTHS